MRRLEPIRDLWILAGITKNPTPIILDRLGFKKSPYQMSLKNKLKLELRPQRGDRYSFYEVYVKKDYTKSGQYLPPGGTVIDVGANIGCFTILAARQVGPTGRVIAIEPDEGSFHQLERNLELNRLRNVTPLRLALGGGEGRITLYNGAGTLFSSIYPKVDGRRVYGQGRSQEVQMTTLEAMMKEEHINRCEYLKMDCEGAEYDILRSMTQELAGRIHQITMEVHRVPRGDPAEIGQNLDRLGYTCVHQDGVSYYRLRSEAARSAGRVHS